jgi:predicted RNA-binding Zn-ribbon protein involved in translation (DUF1610 family)
MTESKFTRKKENFVCRACGTRVSGNGFTDHCPNCLWSRHVDNSPGDRLAGCGGLMEPVGLDRKNGEYRIIYRCQKCGQRKVNRVDEEDNQELVAKLS